jgi:hypothetical protein
MKINWVLSNSTSFAPEIEIERLKNAGPFWGGWQTWRSCSTDNVICHDLDRAGALLKRNFQQDCNLFIPNKIYQTLNRPQGIRLYDGDFVDLDVNNREDIVAMHLAAGQSDIVLLVGFDLAPVEKTGDRLADHRAVNYVNLAKHAILGNNQTQWVLLDHPAELDKTFSDLPNLTQDTLINSARLLGIDI